MLRSAIVTLMIAGVATVAAADTVYKWADTSGQIHYTDRPPEDRSARLLGVFERDVLQEEAGEEGFGDEDFGDEDSAGDFAESEPSFGGEAPGAGGASAETVQSVQADLDRVRSEQCQQAQERYQSYIQSQRLYRQLPNGEREYLTDEELTRERIQAKQAVDDLCR